ncbi:putative allantoate permease [Mollisia scopiformis]|uniref:Putative allantoate permease n=1 Tax=Mollisia scopiformis TaxID=149040 RepID=A0A132B9H8_MOLSC|nr:putative allantoate permease [Mollisia scopiformis]KUJ08327.1 putative allantoate permease [Mollisia scopiformis]
MTPRSNVSTSSGNGRLPLECPASIDEHALVTRIDRRLLPMLFVIYVAAFLDRVNISNALTMSLPKDLKLVGVQKNIALTIFFIPYILFEIPSNILMKRFRPRVWLSGCILAFGIVMLGQGFVTTYRGLLVTRFFLGLAEAGIFPGSFYLISVWYKREESQKRFTLYWCSVLIATAFGGLLASAIANMDGIRGHHNWQWIFILEGTSTIVVGIVAFFCVADFPENAKWLNVEERKFVIARARSMDEAQDVTPRDVLAFFKDIGNVLGGVMYLGVVIPIYSFAYFTPTIIRTYGYSVVQTQLHSVPPVAAAMVLCLITAYLSDRAKVRSPFIAFGIALTVSGLSILMTVHHNLAVEYAGICLVAMGTFSSGAVIVCWYVMNLRSHAERAIGTAWMIGFGNCGGIIATFSFLQADAPYYHTGYSICMGATCICTAAAILYCGSAWRKNASSRGETGNGRTFQY